MAVAYLGRDPHRLFETGYRNQVDAPRPQRSRVQLVASANHDLLLVSANLQNVERRTGGYAQSLTLAHREVMDAAMLAHHLSRRGHQLAGGIGQRLALLSKVCVNKLLVIPAGNKTNLLRIGLL